MKRREALKKFGAFSGTAALTPGLLSLLQACQNQDREQWKPEFFTAEEQRLFSAVADTLIPTTETPGALDVNADVFIDKVIAQLYDPSGKEHFRKELQALGQRCSSSMGASFTALSTTDREAFLMREEEAGGRFNRGVWGTAVGPETPVSFYRSLKSMLVWGYTSSESIGKNVLSYDPIPGAYKGCIPLEDVGNKWSL